MNWLWKVQLAASMCLVAGGLLVYCAIHEQILPGLIGVLLVIVASNWFGKVAAKADLWDERKGKPWLP